MDKLNSYYYLNRVLKDFDSVFDSYALRIKIPESQFWTLYALVIFPPPVTQDKLVREWAMAKQTVNTAVSALAKKGLVELSAVDGSKKKKHISLTEKGREWTEGHIKPIVEVESNAFSCLTEEEQSAFLSSFRKYVDRVGNGCMGIQIGDDEK